MLVVDDDDEFAALLLEYLDEHGYELIRRASGDGAVEQVLALEPDLVVLDLMLPGMNGLDVCRQLRERYSGAILMLTASQSEVDHVAGLEIGADDFVTKPIDPRVLLARIRTQLRRNGRTVPAGRSTSVLAVGALRLDRATRDVSVGDQSVSLTTMEFDVLALLASHAGSVVEREELYTKVLGTTHDGIDRGMDVHISRIRRKLQQRGFDPSRLKSVRGVGYLLAFQ